jgi:transposase
MNLKNIDIQAVIIEAKETLSKEKGLSVSVRLLINLLLTIVELLAGKIGKNSQNSSIPPSQDPNRNKTSTARNKRKPCGHLGHEGKSLEVFETPDEVIPVPLDPASLPKGHRYRKVGVAKRQVVELHLRRHVKEYQLDILEDETGKRYTAESPVGDSPVVYGNSVKAHAVYLSIYQLLPYGRVEEYFCDQAEIPISAGSLFNFNKEAFRRLLEFEAIAKTQLQNAAFLHTDETSINVNGKRLWLHSASNDRWVLFMPHLKRGVEGMKDMDVLPHFKGIMIHDHWKPYFTFDQCLHALCNAHHLRELQAVMEHAPEHQWAPKMKALLLEMNEAVHNAGGVLQQQEAEPYKIRYREILAAGDSQSPPPPEPPPGTKKKQGKIKKTKERNLLERLRDFEHETLRFLTVPYVPFTNNQGENDIRMTKVQQKISGCFKSMDGANIFCRVRSFLLTAQKHGISATDALTTLFNGKLPDFCGKKSEN